VPVKARLVAVLAGGAACLLMVLASVIWARRESAEHHLQEVERRLLAVAPNRAEQFRSSVDSLLRNVRFVAGAPAVTQFAASAPPGQLPALSGQPPSGNVASLFRSFLESHPDAWQIRFIAADAEGREVVRLERVGDRVVQVPPEQLQAKGDTAYFRDAMRLAPGQAGVSAINLNREHGRVQLPPTPTVRVYTPVVGMDGQTAGFVVINAYVSALLNWLQGSIPGDLRVFLTNADGDFLLHPDPRLAFGFDLGRRHTWDQEFRVKDEPPHGRLSAYIGTAGTIYAMQEPVAIDPLRPQNNLTLWIAYPDVELLQELDEASRIALLSSLGAVFTLMLVAYAYSLSTRRAALEQSRLAAVADQSNDAIIGLDLQGRINLWNAAAQRLFGYAEAEAIGRVAVDLIVPADRSSEEAELLRRVSAGEVVPHFESLRRRRDGSTFDVSVTVSPIRSGSGEISGAAKIIRDISAQKAQDLALRESESRIRAIVETAMDGIIVTDESGRIESVNRAGERLFGYAVGEMVGRNIREMMPEPDRGQHDGYLSRYLETGERRIIGIGRETTALRKDGTTFPIALSVSEMAVGGQRKFNGLIRDISQQRASAEQLRRLNETLEQQVEERSRRIGVLSDRLTMATRAVRMGVWDWNL
jgi:two-component system, sensor histidine kinase and response regulator